MIEPRWHSAEDGGKFAVCRLCFRGCEIPLGGTGACGARTYSSEGFASPNLGRFVSVAIDPIEKKPLRRWRPGTKILSLGGLRCNMRCPFCQNHAIAHPDGPIGEYGITPRKLAETAKNSSLTSVAYTYNEPSLQAEYIFAASPVLRDEGIATVMVTNGMFAEEVCREAVEAVDAMNVDVKAFDDDSYRRMGGSLDVVKRNVKRLVGGGVHVELTNLVVPGISDSPDGFAEMIAWIAEVSPDIPLHISRYFPAYKYDKPPTDISLMKKLIDIAKGRLKYVYTGNM